MQVECIIYRACLIQALTWLPDGNAYGKVDRWQRLVFAQHLWICIYHIIQVAKPLPGDIKVPTKTFLSTQLLKMELRFDMI